VEQRRLRARIFKKKEWLQVYKVRIIRNSKGNTIKNKIMETARIIILILFGLMVLVIAIRDKK
jgi:hypothetical protein